MEFADLLNWAFERHLNPLSWYIRPIFLILIASAAYKRSWIGIVLGFLLMMSSMVWFPAPETIDPQMAAVLAFERELFANPITASLSIGAILLSMVVMMTIFWKRSLKLGLIALNVGLIGKLLFSLIFTGENGWGPLGTILFGLILVNGGGALIWYGMRHRRATQHVRA